MKRFFTCALVLITVHGLQAQLDSGMVLHLPFSGNANDQSIWGNHGAVNGATLTTDRFGHDSSAYYFDGIDDYIDCGKGEKLNQSFEAFTVSAWINPGTSNINSRIISNRGRGNAGEGWPGYQFKLRSSGDSATWRFFDSAVEDKTGNFSRCNDCGGQYEWDRWYHIVMMYDTDSILFFVNNVIDGFRTGFNIKDVSNVLPTGIGASLSFNGQEGIYTQFFHGKIDDLRLFDRKLSRSEIDSLFKEDDDLSAVVDLHNNYAVDIYPNPAGNVIFLGYRGTGKVSRGSMVDRLGKTVLQIKPLQDQLDVSSLPNGMYYLILEVNNANGTYRVTCKVSIYR